MSGVSRELGATALLRIVSVTAESTGNSAGRLSIDNSSRLRPMDQVERRRRAKGAKVGGDKVVGFFTVAGRFQSDLPLSSSSHLQQWNIHLGKNSRQKAQSATVRMGQKTMKET